MREAVGAPAPAGRPGRGRRPGARESILDAIRACEPLSRVELAKITGLTEAAVSMTVRRLLEEGLVVETGRTPTGGKPRTLLQLDPTARLAVGVHLDEDTTTYVLTGQTGGVISRLARPALPAMSATRTGSTTGTSAGPAPAPTADQPVTAAPGSTASGSAAPGSTTSGPATAGPATTGSVTASGDGDRLGDGVDLLLRTLAADIDTLLAGSGVDPARCLGVGIVWPGPHSGGPADDPLPHLRGLGGDELGSRLSAATGWPVLVENDATAAAVGEYWVARVGPEQAFAALYMGGGIGAGIVVEGRAMRGSHASAGEFGHLCLDVFGPECWCGSRGCLEVLAGPRTVVSAARDNRVAAAEAGLDLSQPLRSVATEFAAIARAARAGAPHCRTLLETSARYVAAAAETVVNLLDIDLLVLTGPGFAAASAIYGPAIMRRLAPADARTWHRNVTVTVSLAAATASATGAAALVLQSHLRA
ncbi:ROK family transcriptional regulator [Actinoplanes sp. SE50]|uniref:ROK family transcriptional regulator n=1 Tax=unclassified Actinoplanes TaxID=2626549 RepID=UPI00023ED043|nr:MULTISPECIES: ROK family transcriptional regulator [unclassified Actinoplanes]AEV83841.1 N-acetyl-D-glucosamine kinase [Actinoplanes sp. SE50/110]ATO82015.1 ROK family transcriptional regulator [Actinoplanes sp. SE50]SLL99423.1 ROK family transcriptional regulator protein [Actinoplanes sp. SE50/110]